MEHEFKTVGVVGLGLIGGSTAKAIRKNIDCNILAFDISEGEGTYKTVVTNNSGMKKEYVIKVNRIVKADVKINDEFEKELKDFLI